MSQKEEEIDWKDHLTTVIEHMYSSYKSKRPGHNMYVHNGDVSNTPEICNGCQNLYNPSHIAGCDHCFHLEFINSLKPVKIQDYITENKNILTDLIRAAQSWKRFQANIDLRRQELIKDYKELFAHGELIVIDDYEKMT